MKGVKVLCCGWDLEFGPRKPLLGGWDSKVIMLIMVARTLNDHLSYPDVGGEESKKRGRHEATKGADWAFDLAAVIRMSKSSGSGGAGPFEEV